MAPRTFDRLLGGFDLVKQFISRIKKYLKRLAERFQRLVEGHDLELLLPPPLNNYFISIP